VGDWLHIQSPGTAPFSACDSVPTAPSASCRPSTTLSATDSGFWAAPAALPVTTMRSSVIGGLEVGATRGASTMWSGPAATGWAASSSKAASTSLMEAESSETHTRWSSGSVSAL